MKEKTLVLRKVNGGLCIGSTCPAVYETNRDTFVIQGRYLDASDQSVVVLGPDEMW